MISPTTLNCLIEDITIGNKDLTKDTLVSLLRDLYEKYKSAQETIKDIKTEVVFQKDLRNKKDDIIRDLRHAYQCERQKSVFKLKKHHVREIVLDLATGRPIEDVTDDLIESSDLDEDACVQAIEILDQAINDTLEMANGECEQP